MMRMLLFLPGVLIVLGWALWSTTRSDLRDPKSDPGPVVVDPSAAFSDTAGFRRMGPTRPGDWLDRHDEPGQTFREYVAERPIRATEDCNVIAFAPAGTFRPEQAEVAGATFRFAGLWFGLPTRVQKPLDLPEAPFHRVKDFDYLPRPVDQYRTDWFLNRALPKRLTEDSVMLVAVTAADLYPSDDWQYVFGMAHLRRRVGIYSIARYFPRFWGRPARPGDREKALRRACKLVTHELGHCFGLRHCIAWECGMNGSNSLDESDRRPIHLCPECLRKLHWNRKFDVLARYRRLLTFYREQGLAEEADWISARISRIETASAPGADGRKH